MSAALGSGGYGGGQGGQGNGDSYGISVETPGGAQLGGGSWSYPSNTGGGSTSGNLGGGGKGGSGGSSGPYIPGLKPTAPTGYLTRPTTPTAPSTPTTPTTPAAPKPSTGSTTQPTPPAFNFPGANNQLRPTTAPPGSAVGRRVMVQPASSNGTPGAVTVADSAAAALSKPAESAAQQRRDAQLAQPFAPAPSGSYGPRKAARAPSYLQAQNMPGMDVGDMPAPSWEPTPPPAAPAQPQMVAASMQQPVSPARPTGAPEMWLGAPYNIGMIIGSRLVQPENQSMIGFTGKSPELMRHGNIGEGYDDSQYASPLEGGPPRTIGSVDDLYNSPIGPNPRAENPFARYANESLPPGYRDAYLNERILGVEDVPVDATVPGYPAPKPGQGLYGELYGPPDPGFVGSGNVTPYNTPYDQSPSQYDPKQTWRGKILGTTVDTMMRLAPFGMGTLAIEASKRFNQGLTPGQLAQRDLDGYLGMSEQQKAAYDDRANARRASETSREGGGNHDVLPPPYYAPMLKPSSALAAAAPPPPPVTPPPPPPVDEWALPTRNPNPVDPYSYGYGPGYNYFNYS